MDIRAHVIALNTERAKAAKALETHVDECHAAHPGRPMSGEEKEKLDRINADIDRLEDEVRSFVAMETREQESAKVREAHASIFAAPAPSQDQRSEVDRFAAWARGEGSSEYHVDLSAGQRIVEAVRAGADARDIRASLLTDTGSVGSAVPTDLSATLYQYMTASVALMNMPTTKIVTAGGNNLDFPTVAAHGIGTQVIAQGTAIGGTDPTFDKMTLGAYKYGQLLQLASETIQDTGVDILGFVAGNIARAVGEVVATDLAVGTGTAEPNGVMTAITGAGTIATGGSLIDPTYEKLIDLQYSVNGNYRARPSTAWFMRDLTAANLRKLRDGAGGTVGAVLWQPSLTQGIQGAEPDKLLGHNVWTDPNVASLASNAKVIAFGDFSAYYIRIASGFTLERSDDYAFNTDLVTFRGKTRVDADLIDTNAINIIKRSV
jgi:HK97 family phage major capsid protein